VNLSVGLKPRKKLGEQILRQKIVFLYRGAEKMGKIFFSENPEKFPCFMWMTSELSRMTRRRHTMHEFVLKTRKFGGANHEKN